MSLLSYITQGFVDQSVVVNNLKPELELSLKKRYPLLKLQFIKKAIELKLEELRIRIEKKDRIILKLENQQKVSIITEK